MSENAPLRPADDLIRPKVAQTLAELELEDQDQAAAQLAEQYAAEIDGARNRAAALDSLGPKLLACLVELGATPKARSAVSLPGRQPGSSLARLRAARTG